MHSVAIGVGEVGYALTVELMSVMLRHGARAVIALEVGMVVVDLEDAATISMLSLFEYSNTEAQATANIQDVVYSCMHILERLRPMYGVLRF